tara:strand:- start:245 stop:709 length:465 start_codon:yes stop_codon:yes gene_type:complete
MNELNIADIKDYADINNIFEQHREFFPHIRKDYIERNIHDKNVIYQNEVVIFYKKYKRKTKLGNVYASKDNYILHQIATKYHDGRASKIFKLFLENLDNKLYLTVRKNNKKAIEFYIKNKMVEVGSISWKENTIPGCVFLYNNIKDNYEKFGIL